MPAPDYSQELIEAKSAEAQARKGLEARLVAIRQEKKEASAKWKAEEDQIRELLRVRPKTMRPRKSKPEGVPAIERAEQR